MRSETRTGGYLTIDALVALGVTTLAVTASVALASTTVARMNQARDRLAAARVAETLYEDLRVGHRPDGQQSGEMEGRAWSYSVEQDAGDNLARPARRARIVVERRARAPLTIDAVLPLAPATASSN